MQEYNCGVRREKKEKKMIQLGKARQGHICLVWQLIE